MDGKRLKELITKRSTIWTLGFCMTGIIVLGGIASLERAQRGEIQQETEAVPGEQALAGEGSELLNEGKQDLEAVSGGAESTVDGKTGSDAGSKEQLAGASADGASDENGEEAIGADGVGEKADGSENTGGTEEAAAASANGTAGDSDAGENTKGDSDTGEDVERANGEASDGTDAAEAASANIISEQTLMDNGVSYAAGSASLFWPAAGTILIDYSMDGSVYFPTLNQYKYNPALVLGSDAGNQVLASAKGIVESTYIDEETGTTLVLNIGNGYKLTYGGLKDLQAKEGDVLEAGAVIGYVSEPTKYYSKEGSNVYFEMTKDGEPVDPILYLE